VLLDLVWEPPADDKGRPLHLKKIEPSVLRRIQALRILGHCEVAVAKFGLRPAKMGGVHLSWRKFNFQGKDAMAVVTATATGDVRLSFQLSGVLA
jgi:hypothetical protein